MGSKIREGLFHVVPELVGCDAIIGSDFMAEHDITISMGSRRISVGDTRKPRPSNEYYISNINAIKVPPNQETVLYIPDTNSQAEMECLVEQAGHCPEVTCLDGLATKIQYKKKRYVPCVVANFTSEEKMIEKDTLKLCITPKSKIRVCKIEEMNETEKVSKRSDARTFTLI